MKVSDQMKLSQAEIDALLNSGSSTASASTEVQPVVDALTSEEADTLGEIGNISFGSAATSLSALLQQRVDITTPSVTVMDRQQIRECFPDPYVLVAVEFTEGILGSNALAIAINDAKTIADLMLGGDGTNIQGELNEMHLSAVGEAMNQMMGGAATAMSQMFGRYINISPPRVDVIDLASGKEGYLDIEGQMVNVQFQLRVGALIDSRIMQLIPLKFAKDMVQMLQTGPVPGEPPKVAPESAAPVVSRASVESSVSRAPEPPSAYTGTLNQAAATAEIRPTEERVDVRKPEFVDFGEKPQEIKTPQNLSLLYDVQLNVTVELGRSKKIVREILELGPGSILELDKLAGEPVDIFVNNKRIAIGEVIVIDENFGVRVTDIIRPEQRLGKLS